MRDKITWATLRCTKEKKMIEIRSNIYMHIQNILQEEKTAAY